MLQTMSEATATAVPSYLKTDTYNSQVMEVSGLSARREDMSETWLWTASFSFGSMLSSMDVSDCVIVLTLPVLFATVLRIL